VLVPVVELIFDRQSDDGEKGFSLEEASNMEGHLGFLIDVVCGAIDGVQVPYIVVVANGFLRAFFTDYFVGGQMGVYPESAHDFDSDIDGCHQVEFVGSCLGDYLRLELSC